MKEHFENIYAHYSKAGARGVAEWISKLYHRKVVEQASGQCIFDSSWDLCIILDGCRYDLMEKVSGEYGFLTGLEAVTSVGSHSREYYNNTFSTNEDLRDTIIVTANPHSANHVPAEQIKHVDEVWRYTECSHATTPPRQVTDRSIDHARNQSYSRLIVHYMQPHVPFIGASRVGEDFTPAGDPQNNAWAKLQRGELSREKVWKRYKATLRLVLDDVEVLLSNVDAERVLITSDHGNAMGERWLYDHPAYICHPALRKVAWVFTSAKDKNTHTPQEYKQDKTDTLEDQLQALGYR